MSTAIPAATAPDNRLHFLTLAQVQEIIRLNDAYAADLAARLGPKPGADAAAADVTGGASAAGRALIAAMEALSTQARYELVALVWCGMGDYTFTEARAYSQATADTGIAHYLAKKAPVLSDLLKKALATLKPT